MHEKDTLIPRENDNVSKNLKFHEDEKSTIKEQDIEKNHKNLVSKNSDTRSYAKNGLLEYTPQTGLLRSELSSFLNEIKFSDKEFVAGIFLLNIKYNYPEFQNNNLFYPLHDQFDYRLAKYFAEFKNTKSNIDKFLFELLMVLLTEKLFYQNMDKYIEKHSEML